MRNYKNLVNMSSASLLGLWKLTIEAWRLFGVTCCADVHKQFDRFANGEVQVGKLPEWMHVNGKVAWYVYQGPYSELGSKGFSEFWRKFRAAKLEVAGPPGDVYVCSPECHEADKQAKMLTVIWCPVK
jgi:hypothetical protein